MCMYVKCVYMYINVGPWKFYNFLILLMPTVKSLLVGFLQRNSTAKLLVDLTSLRSLH